MKFTIAYLISIVSINAGFEHAPLVSLPDGDKWPPFSLAVGAMFVLRDFVQREIGHRVILVMLLGAALSYSLASPFIAAASVAAYLASEFLDWLIYSFTRMSMHRRILISSAAASPVDSFVFLAAIGHATPTAVALMSASKLLGIAVLFYIIRARAERAVK